MSVTPDCWNNLAVQYYNSWVPSLLLLCIIGLYFMCDMWRNSALKNLRSITDGLMSSCSICNVECKLEVSLYTLWIIGIYIKVNGPLKTQPSSQLKIKNMNNNDLKKSSEVSLGKLFKKESDFDWLIPSVRLSSGKKTDHIFSLH